jgi:D-alanyl-lipoteichoic acid acyltransferase DltB (MBOAT superfamily)
LIPIYVIFGLAYLITGRQLLRAPATLTTTKRFAWLNIVFLFFVILFSFGIQRINSHFLLCVRAALAFTAVYLSAISFHFYLLQRGASCSKVYRLAFWLPICALIAFKIIGFSANLGSEDASWLRERLVFVGISYLSFKLSYSTLEIENGQIKLPGYYAYVGYALFVPTLFVGPINSFVAQSTLLEFPLCLEKMRPHFMRIAMGLLKMTFLAGLVERLGYKALITSSATTEYIDYLIAPCANFIYLYLNFSGACDIAIAISALLGIYIKENFNRPFIARNVQDFWNRWHITLSLYMRDVVFSPLTLWLTGKLGVGNVNHCIPISIMAVFAIIGLWHGTTINFILMGLLYGLAVVFNHYFTLSMKLLLGKSYKKVHSHPVVTAVSIALTFYFVSVTALLLNNDVDAFITCVRMIMGLGGPVHV